MSPPRSTPVANRWLRCLRAAPNPALRLVCIPHAGGGPTAYRTWPPQLPANWEIWAAHLPGREGRYTEKPLTDSALVADQIAAAIEGTWAGPWALFGHSMGALLAWEVAQRLRPRSQPELKALIVAGFRAPHLPARSVASFELPDDEFLELLASLSGTPPEILANRDMMDVLVPLLRADFELYQTYRFREVPKLTCPVFALCGEADPEVSAEAMAHWRDLCAGAFSLRMFRGGHFFTRDSESAVLAAIRNALGISA